MGEIITAIVVTLVLAFRIGETIARQAYTLPA